MPSNPLTSSSAPSAAGDRPPRWGDRKHVRSVVPPVLADRISHRSRPRSVLQLLWHERVVHASGREVRLTIPLVGLHDADLGRRVAAHLNRLWRQQLAPGAEQLRSVSALVEPSAGRSLLLVFLTLDRVPAGRRIDDARFARHLRNALAQATQQGLPG